MYSVEMLDEFERELAMQLNEAGVSWDEIVIYLLECFPKEERSPYLDSLRSKFSNN